MQYQRRPATGVSVTAFKKAIAIPEAGILIVMLFLIALFQLLNPLFLSPLNIAGMLRAMAYPGIVAVGMGFCLINGVIDLSVGAIAGLASVLFAHFSDFGIIVASMIAITGGLCVGVINGLIITRLNVTPFIMTICSMYMVRGLGSWISNGYNIYPLPAGFSELGVQEPLGLSWAFWIMCAIMIITALVLEFSVWGLCVRAIGSDEESARCTEVNVPQVRTSIFILSGGLAAISGILVSLILNTGNYTVGTGWELIAVAACAIGGISLFGYEGSLFGLFCGLITLQIIQNGIIFIGVSPYSQQIVVGVILLLAMVMEVRRRKWFNLERL